MPFYQNAYGTFTHFRLSAFIPLPFSSLFGFYFSWRHRFQWISKTVICFTNKYQTHFFNNIISSVNIYFYRNYIYVSFHKILCDHLSIFTWIIGKILEYHHETLPLSILNSTVKEFHSTNNDCLVSTCGHSPALKKQVSNTVSRILKLSCTEMFRGFS